METTDLIEVLSRGEDSRHQFKENFTNADALAAEIVAFSNSAGGQIFVGVQNDGSVLGLSHADIDRLNQLISNSASQNVRPAVNPLTDNVPHPNGTVLVVTVAEGINKFTGDLAHIFGGEPIFFMLAVMAGLLFIGCFLEPGAAIVLFVPLLFPVARTMGIDLLQFSMLVILTLTMGLITPPVGVCLFVACKIGDMKISTLVKALAPFFLAEVCVIVLIILIPGLSSWLPGLFH